MDGLKRYETLRRSGELFTAPDVPSAAVALGRMSQTVDRRLPDSLQREIDIRMWSCRHEADVMRATTFYLFEYRILRTSHAGLESTAHANTLLSQDAEAPKQNSGPSSIPRTV